MFQKKKKYYGIIALKKKKNCFGTMCVQTSCILSTSIVRNFPLSPGVYTHPVFDFDSLKST